MSRAANKYSRNSGWVNQPKSGIQDWRQKYPAPAVYTPPPPTHAEKMKALLKPHAGRVPGPWLDAREASRMPIISRDDFNFTPYVAPTFRPDAQVAKLLDMLTYKRVAFSETDELFIEKFLEPYSPQRDTFGNLYVEVGESPNILWSSHTDTVHHDEGRQCVTIEGDFAKVFHAPELMGKTNCLGADDAAGIWLMTQMIEANIPGLYLFHRDEEAGGKGSNWLLMNAPRFFDGIDFAIAFDRKGYDSIITHQGGRRTASQAFAESFAAIMPIGLCPDDGGTFTDTAVYAGVIPECSNISVGYHNAHGPMESLDLAFVVELRDALLAADFSKLVCDRDPKAKTNFESYWSHFDDDVDVDTGWKPKTQQSRRVWMADILADNPDGVAEYLETLGICKQDLIEFLDEAGYATEDYK